MALLRIYPHAWRPEKAPKRARVRQNDPQMQKLMRLQVPGVGPEDVAIDQNGRLITGLQDGRIIRRGSEPGDNEFEVLAFTGGRPLGIEVLPDGRLVVCDAHRGLLRVDPDDGTIETLVDRVAGKPLMLCNNAAVASDGTIYFSDSSQRFGLEHYIVDLLEHAGTGRLLRLDTNGDIDVVLSGLQFANGVALAPDESFVAVAESGGYQLRRVWLSGPSDGKDEFYATNLPGVPDNLSTGSDGNIWLALAVPRNAMLDAVAPIPPLRQVAAVLPDFLRPNPASTSWVVAIDAGGKIVVDLESDKVDYRFVTGVRERDGYVYISGLEETALGVVQLDATDPRP